MSALRYVVGKMVALVAGALFTAGGLLLVGAMGVHDAVSVTLIGGTIGAVIQAIAGALLMLKGIGIAVWRHRAARSSGRS